MSFSHKSQLRLSDSMRLGQIARQFREQKEGGPPLARSIAWHNRMNGSASSRGPDGPDPKSQNDQRRSTCTESGSIIDLAITWQKDEQLGFELCGVSDQQENSQNGGSNVIEGHGPRYGEDLALHFAVQEGSVGGGRPLVAEVGEAAGTVHQVQPPPPPNRASPRPRRHIVLKVTPGGAAARAGLRVNDNITDVNGVDMTKLSRKKVIQQIWQTVSPHGNEGAKPDAADRLVSVVLHSIRLKIHRTSAIIPEQQAGGLLGMARKQAVVWEQPDPDACATCVHSEVVQTSHVERN